MILYYFEVQIEYYKTILVVCLQTSLQSDFLKESKDEDFFHHKITHNVWRR